MKLFGAVEILIGAVIAFYGIKVYEYLIFFFAFAAFGGAVMGVGFSFYSSDATPLIISAVVAIIGGVALGYFTKELIRAYGIPLLGLVCGGTISMMLMSAFDVSVFVKLGVMAVAALAGAYVGYAYNNFIKVAGMAIIGSGMIVHGIGQYAGGFPPLMLPAEASDLKPSKSFIAYGVGFVVLAVVAYFVQKQQHVPNEDGKDAFDEE